MLGRGRPAKQRSIGTPRVLSADDVAKLERAQLPAFQKFRDSYHRIARLAALGLRPDEIAFESGYGVGRINQLLADPTMQARVEAYREMVVNPDYVRDADEFMTNTMRARNMQMRLLCDKLEGAEPDDVSYRDLHTGLTLTMDRTGYGKVSTVKVQQDLSERLAQALTASGKVIEHRQIKDITPKKDSAA